MFFLSNFVKRPQFLSPTLQGPEYKPLLFPLRILMIYAVTLFLLNKLFVKVTSKTSRTVYACDIGIPILFIVLSPAYAAKVPEITRSFFSFGAYV